MTEHLTVEDLLALVEDLDIGPVRDVGLLEAAAHRPTTSLWGREAYPDLEQKAAALLESIVGTRPLVDGNTRLGWLATVVFLDLNGRWLDAPDDEAYDLWHDMIGLPPERIVRIGDNKGAPYASDNFWQMADTGPCGPCTEIFYDHGDGVWGGPPDGNFGGTLMASKTAFAPRGKLDLAVR